MSGPYHCKECPASFAFEQGAWMHTVRVGHVTDASPEYEHEDER